MKFPNPTWVGAGAALAVGLWALPLPWMLDDWFHLDVVESILSGQEPSVSGGRDGWGLPTLFEFVNEENRERVVAEGWLPWWTAADLKITFWRPLSTALGFLDHWLAPRSSTFAHFHSLIWMVVLGALAGRLYQRLLGPALATLCAVLYAVDDSHVLPLYWIANRNALVATVFALGALLAHVHASDTKKSLPTLASGLLTLCSLLAGEAGAAGLALLFAWQLVFSNDSWITRLTRLAPNLLAGLIWLPGWLGSGAGTAASAMYTTPHADPSEWLQGALTRLPIQMGNAFGLIAGDAILLRPEAEVPLAVQGLTLLAVVASFSRRAWGGLDSTERQAAVFGALSLGMGVLPGLATLPQNRMMLLPGFGSMILIALISRWCWQNLRTGPWRLDRVRGILVIPILLVHLVWSTLSWPLVSHAMRSAHLRHEAPLAHGQPGSPGRESLLIGVSDPALGFYFRAACKLQGKEHAGGYHLISSAAGRHRVTRSGHSRLTVEPLEGALLGRTFDRLIRDELPQVGDSVDLTDFSVRVNEVGASGISSIQVDLHGEPDRFELTTWTAAGFATRPLPTVGDSVTLDWERGPSSL
jgi:hypothetical protein